MLMMIDTVSGKEVHGPHWTVLLPPEELVGVSTEWFMVDKSIVLSKCTKIYIYSGGRG